MRLFVLLAALFVAVPAWAGTLAVVDFQRAVTETDEGKAAQDRLDKMYSSRKTEIDNMRATLETRVRDFEARAVVLSPEAANEERQQIAMLDQQFQQTYMNYQQEMQQNYYTLLQDLDTKMRALTDKIARERGYSLVVDMAAVVYVGGDTVDMTDELIQRYNAQ